MWILDHFSVSLTIAEWDFRRFLSVSHTVTDRLLRMTDADKVMNHNSFGAIRQTSGSRSDLLEIIPYLESTVGVDQYVVRFDVAVNNVERMNVVQSWRSNTNISYRIHVLSAV